MMSYAIGGGATTVDCQNQVRSWRLLRSILELLIPTCNGILTKENQEFTHEAKTHNSPTYILNRKPSSTPPPTITGMLFGYRHGKVNFCIQTSPKSLPPILLLELAISTNVLAKEMKGGSIRFAFECKRGMNSRSPLLSMPLWTMYCNGRKVGCAVKRKPSRADMEVLQQVQTVVVGAGITRVDHDVMYLRGKFERFHGSAKSESFHLIDPDGNNNGQELSFYFLRSG